MGLFDVFKKKIKMQEKPYTTAIIAAAGSGSRMGDICADKQFLLINNMPILAYSLLAFEEAKTIDEIIIVTKEENILPIADLVKDYEITKATKIIKGGSTRQQSVFNAIGELSEKTKVISVHDGARPFVSPQIIDDVSRGAYQYNAAATYVKVKDTIKQLDENGFIKATIDRAFLGAIQTPQTFSLELYLACSALAEKRGVFYTDDCQLIEQGGGKVFLVEGSYDNIKITTKEDIAFARAIASSIKE